eukprot:1727484-Rhodomonas_salina.1
MSTLKPWEHQTPRQYRTSPTTCVAPYTTSVPRAVPCATSAPSCRFKHLAQDGFAIIAVDGRPHGVELDILAKDGLRRC